MSETKYFHEQQLLSHVNYAETYIFCNFFIDYKWWPHDMEPLLVTCGQALCASGFHHRASELRSFDDLFAISRGEEVGEKYSGCRWFDTH